MRKSAGDAYRAAKAAVAPLKDHSDTGQQEADKQRAVVIYAGLIYIGDSIKDAIENVAIMMEKHIKK